jgi:hypothetical protein
VGDGKFSPFLTKWKNNFRFNQNCTPKSKYLKFKQIFPDKEKDITTIDMHIPLQENINRSQTHKCGKWTDAAQFPEKEYIK